MTTQPPERPAATNDKRALIADSYPARHRGPAAGEGAVVIGRLARLARAVVESASEATLLIQGSALGPGSPVAALRDDNGWPVFWCGLGSAVAVAGAANRSALLTVRGTENLGEDVTVTLTGRLEVIGWSWERGRQIGAIILTPEQVLVETTAGGGTGKRRHEVPVADYADVAPDTLAACAAHLAGHTNTVHGRELREFVAARAGVPAGQVASAWLDGLDERGALVRWVDSAGAHVMPTAFPRQARTTTELAMLLREQLAGHHQPPALPERPAALDAGARVTYARPPRSGLPDRRVAASWPALARSGRALPDETLRIEPGCAVSAYCGWYVTRVLDVKRSRGAAFGVVAGGTHHLRTPAAKGHSQPFSVIADEEWPHPWARPGVTDQPVTVTGQLCTPKDVLACDVRVRRLRAGDLIAFGMAGAYAWNISHTRFLMHVEPGFHYIGEGE